MDCVTVTEVPATSTTAERAGPSDAETLRRTDPGPLQFGNTPERDGDVRGFANFSEDINIFKVFPVGGDQRELRFEVQIGNLFDRRIYCNPNTNWSSPAFGQVFTQCNTPRSVQLGFKYNF